MSDDIECRIEFLRNKIDKTVEENFGYFPSADNNMCEWLDELNILQSIHGDLTALREENEILKSANADLIQMSIDASGPCKDIVHCVHVPALREENERLKADKRELVDALKKVKEIFWYREAVAVIDAAVAKHKEV